MAQIDYHNKNVDFLTRLFFVLIGLFVFVAGGSISILIKNQPIIFFWLGVVVVIAIGVGLIIIFKYIRKSLEEIKKL